MPDYFAEVHPKIRAFMRRSLSAPVRDEEFWALALELFQAQRLGNLAYARFCDLRGTKEISCAPTVAFKEMEMTALLSAERERVFYSSGTTQRDRSRHFHSRRSLEVYEESLWLWFENVSRGRVTDLDWIFLTPSAKKAPTSSLAHMFGTIAARQRRAEFFGMVSEGGEWELRVEALADRLLELERNGTKVALLGTAFQFVHLLDELEKRGAKMKLPEGSWILETGGYKGRSRAVPKEELRGALSEGLGIKSIFGEYGMSELSSQAYDLGDGVFRFPSWARARIVSPEHGREVAIGERGLIQVYDLANIWSVMAVQTEDIGIRLNEGFSLAGRAALAGARGCSLMSR